MLPSMLLYTHIIVLYTHTHTHTHAHTRTYPHTYIHTYLHTHAHARMRTCTYTHQDAYIHTRRYTQTHRSTYVHKSRCVHTHTVDWGGGMFLVYGMYLLYVLPTPPEGFGTSSTNKKIQKYSVGPYHLFGYNTMVDFLWKTPPI